MAGKVYQLDAFRSEQDIINKEFKDITERSIRGLFARHNETEYVVLEMHKQLRKLQEFVYGKKDLGLAP